MAIDGRAYGLIARSGVGKSSTAAHLLGRGAGFVTDDVLVLEEVAGRLMAHPGARLARLHGRDLDALAPAACRRLGQRWGQSDGKHHLRPEGVSGPLPLAALVFLTHAQGHADMTLDPAPDSVPRLLAVAQAPHIATRRRLEVQLAVCAAAHRDVALWRARIPPGWSAADVAKALWHEIADRQ